MTIRRGVATVRRSEEGSPVALVAAGDAALHRGKQEGGSRVAVAEA